MDRVTDVDYEAMREWTMNREAHARNLRERGWCGPSAPLVPPRFRDADLTMFNGPEYDDVRAWAADPGSRNLIAFGPTGPGKTALAVAALRPSYWDRGASFAFWPVTELVDAIKPGGAFADVSPLGNVSVLVLDDFAAERSTDWWAMQLYTVVNRRWLNELPTIVTTNLNPRAMEKAIDPRTYSRLYGGSLVFEVSGRDRRR